MPRSRAGWAVARFPNNNRVREGRILIRTSPFSANGGKQAATRSLSCSGNSWPVATHTPMSRCMNNLFACAPLGRKNPQASDLLPRPPLLARDASFLFLRRSEEVSAEEQETLLMLRSLHAEVNQA